MSNETTSSLTERRNPRTVYIDRMTTRQTVRTFIQEDKAVIKAIEDCSESIAMATEIVVATFKKGGRLIYVGAGTSGRIGVLDASECPPTFGVDSSMVMAIMAGGVSAITNAVEGAEDDFEKGYEELQFNRVCSSDTVIGITASGTTPYVLGALKAAKSAKAKCIFLTCNPYCASPGVDLIINPVTGPETITGSTRLKAGTACKIVLNIISSVSMIKIGKVYENLMVDLKTNSNKLKKRALGIVMEGARVPNYIAEAKLVEAGGNVKLAIMMAKLDCTIEEAREKLDESNGILYVALGELVDE